MTFRDEKRAMRRDIHEALSVPAIYVIAGQADIPVTVRLHIKFADAGNQGAMAPADRADSQPKILFMRDQVNSPARGAIVSVAPGEAYRVGESDKPNDITVSAAVVVMKPSETVGLPVPA